MQPTTPTPALSSQSLIPTKGTNSSMLRGLSTQSEIVFPASRRQIATDSNESTRSDAALRSNSKSPVMYMEETEASRSRNFETESLINERKIRCEFESSKRDEIEKIAENNIRIIERIQRKREMVKKHPGSLTVAPPQRTKSRLDSDVFKEYLINTLNIQYVYDSRRRASNSDGSTEYSSTSDESGIFGIGSSELLGKSESVGALESANSEEFSAGELLSRDESVKSWGLNSEDGNASNGSETDNRIAQVNEELLLGSVISEESNDSQSLKWDGTYDLQEICCEENKTDKMGYSNNSQNGEDITGECERTSEDLSQGAASSDKASSDPLLAKSAAADEASNDIKNVVNANNCKDTTSQEEIKKDKKTSRWKRFLAALKGNCQRIFCCCFPWKRRRSEETLPENGMSGIYHSLRVNRS